MTRSKRRAAAPGEAAADTERQFQTFRRTRDASLRAELVAHHENLVRFLAGKFANRGEPLEDLTQVGMIGLINAVDRFEPERGIKFSTYATPTIVGEIKRYFRDRAWNIKVPRWLQELNLRVVKTNDALTQSLGRPPTVKEVADHLGCTEEDALSAMELGNAYETVSLDSRLALEGDAPLTLNDSVGSQDLDINQIDSYDDLKDALEQLDNREKLIIYLRFFQELSQTEVARRLRISQMHVSRLQHRALRRLRTLMAEAEEALRRAA